MLARCGVCQDVTIPRTQRIDARQMTCRYVTALPEPLSSVAQFLPAVTESLAAALCEACRTLLANDQKIHNQEQIGRAT